MAKANYIKHPNPMYRGNLLAEGLGFPLSKKEIQSRTNIPFEGALDLNEVPIELHSYYMRSSILNLFSMHITQDEMVEVYETIRLGIEVSYLRRNPLTHEVARILAAIERDKETPFKATHIKKLNLLESSFTFLISGLSGRGKTSMIKQALSLIDQKIEHNYHEVDDEGNVISFNHEQITYLYVEHHERAGQKKFLTEVLSAVDDAVGNSSENSYAYAHRNSDVKDLIVAVRKAIFKHHIGTIIIDEAQNFAKASKDLKLSPNERISMRYVEELVNSLGVSTIFVGTFGALELFSQEMTITRRTIKAGSLNLASCPVDSSFWIRLCDALFGSIILPNGLDDKDLLRLKIHELSAGIPAIAVSIVQATLRFLSYYEEGDGKKLSLDALDYVYEKQFSSLSGPIAALIDGDYHKYEDFKAMKLLEKINPNESGIENEQLKKVEQDAMEMVEAYKQYASVPLQGKVQLVDALKVENPHEVGDKAVAVTEQLSPNNFMSILGGGS